MPTIPTYEGDYIAPGQVPGLQVNAPSAAQIDAGVSNMLAHVADASKQIYVQASETRAEDAANKYYDASLVLTKKITQLQGADASPEAFQKYNEDLANLRKQYVGSLENNAYAAHKFDQFATKIDRQHLQQAEDHTFKEYSVYKATTNKVSLNRELTSYIAADGAQEDDAKAAFFRVQRDQLGESADEKVLNEAWNKTKSAALGQIAIKKMDDLGAADALVFLGERKKEMDPVEWAKIKDQADRKLDNDKADNAAFALSSKYSIDDPNMAAGMLEESKTITDAKTFAKFNNLLNIKMQQQHARANQIVAIAFDQYDPVKSFTAKTQDLVDSLPPQYRRDLETLLLSKGVKQTAEEKQAVEAMRARNYADVQAAIDNGNIKLASELRDKYSAFFDEGMNKSITDRITNYNPIQESLLKSVIATKAANIKNKELRAQFETELQYKITPYLQSTDAKMAGDRNQQFSFILKNLDGLVTEIIKTKPEYMDAKVEGYGTDYKPTGSGYKAWLDDYMSGDLDRRKKAAATAIYWQRQGVKIHVPPSPDGKTIQQVVEADTIAEPKPVEAAYIPMDQYGLK